MTVKVPLDLMMTEGQNRPFSIAIPRPGREETHMATTRPCGVHLTGSVALADADEVFRTGGSILGRHLRRIPDGETGPRANWIGWQVPVLAAMPGIEMGAPKIQPGYDLEYPQLQLADGASPADTELGPLGYAANALESYKTFTTVRSEGVLPADCRFQVSLPTPLALAAVFFVERDRAALEDMYEERMYREIDEITAAIPHQDLAIQWDVAVEFAILENLLTGYDDPRKDVLDRLAGVSSHRPGPG